MQHQRYRGAELGSSPSGTESFGPRRASCHFASIWKVVGSSLSVPAGHTGLQTKGSLFSLPPLCRPSKTPYVVLHTGAVHVILTWNSFRQMFEAVVSNYALHSSGSPAAGVHHVTLAQAIAERYRGCQMTGQPMHCTFECSCISSLGISAFLTKISCEQHQQLP